MEYEDCCQTTQNKMGDNENEIAELRRESRKNGEHIVEVRTNVKNMEKQIDRMEKSLNRFMATVQSNMSEMAESIEDFKKTSDERYSGKWVEAGVRKVVGITMLAIVTSLLALVVNGFNG